MQSEQQHIDDFFRKKEEEYQHDTGDAGIQWERMRGMMAKPLPPAPKGFRLLSTRRVIKYLGGFAVVTIITLVSLNTFRSHRKTATPRTTAVAAGSKTTATRVATNTPVQPTAATTRTSSDAISPKGRKSAGTGQPSHASAAAGKKPFAGTGNRSSKAPPSIVTNAGPDQSLRDQTYLSNKPSGRAVSGDLRIAAPAQTSNNHTLIVSQPATPASNNERLVVTATETQAVTKPSVAAAQINAFYHALAKPANVFTVDVEQETILSGREGTRLIIPPHSFATSTGILKNQLVTLVLEEYYSYDDMLAARLTTTSGEDQLISNGMVKLTAHCNGKPVNIAYRKTIQLEMPAPRFDPDMQLFRGTRSSLKDAYRAAFVENRMIDTIHFKKLEADENGDIDWIPEDQLQSARKTSLLDRNIIVFNPYGDPYKVSRGRRTKAYVYLSKKCPLSKRQMEKLIIEHSNNYFDKVRFIRVDAVPVANYRFMEDRASIAGDSMQMTFRQALRKKLLSPADSLSILQRLRADSTNLAGLPETSNKYRFTIGSLGYFNCDKFNRQPDHTPNVLFAFNPGEGFERSSMVTHLVFTRYKSVIKGNYKGNKINFGRIPQDEPVKVLCLGVKNGKVMACMQDLNTSKDEIANLVFTETTPEQFKQQLQAVSAALP